MTDAQARFTPLEKVLSLLLIAGLIGIGLDILMKRDSGKEATREGEDTVVVEAETSDISDVTTIKEYQYVPADKLPTVEGDSQYRWDPNDRILRFSYNVWPGWLPVIAANHGVRPTTDSIFYKKYGFRVEMVLMDNPVAARNAFAAGEVHTLWGTVDMWVLLAEDLMKDSRASPRIVQQIDWSSGGDGIVVRQSTARLRDLRDKTVALAQYSPSEYYLALLLLSAGLGPAEVGVRYTTTPFEASAALVADMDVDACVSRVPDMYRIPERVEDTRVLPSQSNVLKLMADVYAVRADFAQDHPEIVEGLIAGIFEGMDYVRQSPKHGVRWMADAFGLRPEEVMEMRSDVHPTNFPENVQFFLNSANPANFERTWENASYIYEKFGRIHSSIPFDQVMDFTFLQKLQMEGAFSHQVDESIAAFAPSAFKEISEESPILTQAVWIGFYPNSANPYEAARDEHGNALMGKLYDPNVDVALKHVAWITNQFDRAVILIEGHADSSMKGSIPVQSARALSLSRAEAIQRALMDRYRFDPNKFSIEVRGRGWDAPVDTKDPDNQMLNRRVEITVLTDKLTTSG